MGRLQRSIDLAKASWRMLRADRELLALPVFSFVASLAVLAAFAALVVLVDYDSARGFEEFELSSAGTILLVIAGMVLAVVATYFQAAMVSGARERIGGGDPTVGSAIAAASSRLGVIVPWALFSWTIGAVLRVIEENAGALGRFIVGMIGVAFRVVTFLAVPVLVVERLGPIRTLKRSGELFRQTWGENLAAQAGIGIVAFLALIPGLLLAGLAAAVVSPVLALVVAVPWIAVVAVVTTSLTAVYQTALYHYVTTGEIPATFDGADLAGAFTTR
jgi:hypothetical protein